VRTSIGKILMFRNRQLCIGRTGNRQLEEAMTELFYWKEIERRARAAQALAMLHNGDADGVNHANAILDELCLDRKGAERLIMSRMPPRPSRGVLSSSRATRPPSVG
jgi:hypothetical protein